MYSAYDIYFQLIAALDPKTLAIPAALADLLLPNAFGYAPGKHYLRPSVSCFAR